MAFIEEYLRKGYFKVVCTPPASMDDIKDKVRAAFISSNFRLIKLSHGHDPIIVSKKGSRYYVKVTSRAIKKVSHKQYMRILAYMRQYFAVASSMISSDSGHSALNLEFEIKAVKVRREGK